MVFFGVFVWVLFGWLCFSPVASRVSARQPSYFFLRRQKKVTKKKASHVRALRVPCATRSVRDTCKLASLKQCSVLIRTLLRCSARPNGGFEYLTARPLRELRPGCSFAALTSRGLGLPHFSRLTSHHGQPQGLPLHPSKTAAVPQLRHSAHSRGIHVPLHSNIDAATTRSMTACAEQRCPHHPHHSPSFLTPHFSPSLLTPHSSFLPPHPSPLISHPSLLTPPSSLLTPFTKTSMNTTPVIPGLTRNLSLPSNAFRRCTACRARALPEGNSGTGEQWAAHRARHAVPLHQTPSFLTPHFSSWATTRAAPTASLLTPTPSLLRPHSSLLTPHPSMSSEW